MLQDFDKLEGNIMFKYGHMKKIEAGKFYFSGMYYAIFAVDR